MFFELKKLERKVTPSTLNLFCRNDKNKRGAREIEVKQKKKK